MSEQEVKKLLKDKRVLEEISRHQWIQSEKNGYDIGFEKASSEWLERFSKSWMEYHMPKKPGFFVTHLPFNKVKSKSGRIRC
ncbi:MAG: hypothetical protein HQL27_05845 [Candidatus Omnitrophica bacterium]|nr:hypothetical protein [Candidatus Omnitrophota bacterium]